MIDPRVMEHVDAVVDRIAAATDGRVVLDAAAVLDARGQAAHRGPVSAGGACRMIRAADGWIAVSLPRPGDVDLLPAWLGLPAGLGATVVDDPRAVAEQPPAGEGAWAALAAAAAVRPAAELIGFGRELGLAVAGVGQAGGAEAAVVTPRSGPAQRGRGAGGIEGLRVVDLATMWAGPLCGSVLAAAGMRVTKFESTSRPDGARQAHIALFDSLNRAKQRAAADVRTPAGRAMLAALVDSADVVIEASRPRALQQLGVDRQRWPGRLWVSITGHGRDDPGIAFGDDAAAAGGLVEWVGPAPNFIGDAIADPLTGLFAGALSLETLATGRAAFVDVSMSGVAASVARR